MAEQKRVFIAIDISDEARHRIGAYMSGKKPLSRGSAVKWESSEKLHLTLKFLGSVPSDRMGPINDVVRELASGFDNFTLAVSGTGVFPSLSDPRILWLGVEGAGILAIAAGIDAACGALGFEREQRSYSPHLTIARIKEPAANVELVQTHLAAEFEPVSVSVGHLTLYESQLLRSGSVYSAIARYPLRA